MEVLEIINILPQIENVIPNIRVIAIQKCIYFGQQTVSALLGELSFQLMCQAFHLM